MDRITRDITERFLGSWSLVSWTAKSPDGSLFYPFGEDAVGRIIYQADGQMAAHLMRRQRTMLAADQPRTAPAAECKAAFLESIAYCGSFTIQAAADTVTHHVVAASYPHWVGTDLVRHFQFLDERLTLSLVNADGAPTALVWERL